MKKRWHGLIQQVRDDKMHILSPTLTKCNLD